MQSPIIPPDVVYYRFWADAVIAGLVGLGIIVVLLVIIVLELRGR